MPDPQTTSYQLHCHQNMQSQFTLNISVKIRTTVISDSDYNLLLSNSVTKRTHFEPDLDSQYSDITITRIILMVFKRQCK